MAANKTLDPTSCTTAAEAFKYSLPQVRQFHRSLTVELDEKNARLRTLVGGSYRQLLGTADTILQMKADIQNLEDEFGRISQGCSRDLIGSMADGLAKLHENKRTGRLGDDMMWTASVKVLDMCEIIAGRLLRKCNTRGGASEDTKGQNLVLAARVLVLSRLLAKRSSSLAVNRNLEDQILVDSMKSKLACLRRRLLGTVDRTLKRVGADNREDLTHALAAYSLTTNSGAKDVLRYFLHLRGNALVSSLDGDVEDDSSGVIKALNLYSRTLLDVQNIVPQRLSKKLATLKAKPLLKDEFLRELEGLWLDICERWFGEEIRFFVPYIIHNDLDGPRAIELLKIWVTKASDLMLEGVSKSLERVTDFKMVVNIRTNIFELWIREGGKVKGFDPSTILDSLREVFNARMVKLIQFRISKLHLVGTELEATVSSWKRGTSDEKQSLWEPSMLNIDIANGAGIFKQEILARSHGRNNAVSCALRRYKTWRGLVDEIITSVEQLKKQQWDANFDIEDDLFLELRSHSLNVEDPQLLQQCLESSLKHSYSVLQEKIELLIAASENSEHITDISCYMLRILRDLRTELPRDEYLRCFGFSLIPPLHQRLALAISRDCLAAFTRNFSRQVLVGRALWEGNPELPVQPCATTFKLLHSLTLAMGKAGADLWSPAAVQVLKIHLRIELARRWAASLYAWSTKDPGGVSDESELAANLAVDEKMPKDCLTQAFFDFLILNQAFSVRPSSCPDEFTLLQDRFLHSATGLHASLGTRLAESAKEYWKKTSLLFGILA